MTRNISDDADSNDVRVIVWALQDVKESLDALVEQQRIANLIALAHHCGFGIGEVEQIRKGLGL